MICARSTWRWAAVRDRLTRSNSRFSSSLIASSLTVLGIFKTLFFPILPLFKAIYRMKHLDRLVEYVNTVLTIPISRSQLADVLTQEGLKWYQEKTYFGESPDPQFVEKRGRL